MSEQTPSGTSRQRTPVWVWFAAINFVGLIALACVVVYLVTQKSDSNPAVVAPLAAAPAAQPAHSETVPSQAPADADAEHAQTVHGGGPSIAEIVKQVDRGVVYITALDTQGDEIGIGSGFVLAEEGLVATNYHVISRASNAQVQFHDGQKLPVIGLRGWDQQADLAILEIEPPPAGMKALALATAETVTLGTQVVSIGHPQGFRFTPTQGIVNSVRATSELPPAVRAAVRAPAGNLWIQHDAPISQGNSGGPLLNLEGEVVGVNTWVGLGGENLSFALHARHLAELVEQLQPQSVPFLEALGPTEQINQAIADFTSQYGWLAQRLREVDTEKAQQELIDSKHPGPATAARLWELADQHPKTPAALGALFNVCRIAALEDAPKQCAALRGQALERIGRDFLTDPAIDGLLLSLGGSHHPDVIEFLRRTAKESPHHNVQGVGWYALAMLLGQGKQEGDVDEAVEILQRIGRDFADVNAGGYRLGDIVEEQAYALEHLAVGRKAMEIRGRDADGKELKLSDFVGKVVLLDFWADWCPHCVQMYPKERQMLEELADKPFAIVGVNTDQATRLKQVEEQKLVTWRSFADGPNGPIASNWRVQSIPTIYLLDHKGVIRYKDIRGEELEAAVKQLLAEVPSAPSSPDSTSSKKAAVNGEDAAPAKSDDD